MFGCFLPPGHIFSVGLVMLQERCSSLCDLCISCILNTSLKSRAPYMFNSHKYWRQHGSWLKLQPFGPVLFSFSLSLCFVLGGWKKWTRDGEKGRSDRCCCPKWELQDQTVMLAAWLSWGRGGKGWGRRWTWRTMRFYIYSEQLRLKTNMNHSRLNTWTPAGHLNFSISIMTSPCFTASRDTKQITLLNVNLFTSQNYNFKGTVESVRVRIEMMIIT